MGWEGMLRMLCSGRSGSGCSGHGMLSLVCLSGTDLAGATARARRWVTGPQRCAGAWRMRLTWRGALICACLGVVLWSCGLAWAWIYFRWFMSRLASRQRRVNQGSEARCLIASSRRGRYNSNKMCRAEGRRAVAGNGGQASGRGRVGAAAQVVVQEAREPGSARASLGASSMSKSSCNSR